MNGWDIILIAVIAAAILIAAAVIIRNKKNGKHSCGGDCSRCSGCVCPEKKNK